MSQALMSDMPSAKAPEPGPDGNEPMPPYANRAEQAVLGAMMLNPDTIADVVEIIGAEDLYRPAHQALAAVIFRRAGRDQPNDLIALTDALDAQTLTRLGGPEYLHTLTHACPTAINADYWAEIIAKHSHKRALIAAGNRLMQIGWEHQPDEDTATLDERARSVLDQYEDSMSAARSGPPTIGAEFDAWFAEKLDGQPPEALSTGLSDLDELTDVRPGELLIVAARPSVGKTLLALKLAVHNARQGNPVLFFSLEMSRAEMLERIVAAVCTIDHSHLKDKRLTPDDQARIEAHRDEIVQLPLYVEDATTLTMAQITATAREYRRRHGVELLAIDYLGLVQPDKSSRDANRERQVAEMTAASKALAKQLEVPVVLVVQINRGPEQRADKRPQMADLRESGAIEADANQVWLMHRPELTAPEDEKMLPENHPGEVQVTVAKNRGRNVGSQWFAFRGRMQDIGDISRH